MLFRFNDLIKKYSTECILVKIPDGTYIGGEYQPGEPERTEVTAAVTSMNASKVYQSGGAYTTQDRNMYILADEDPIDLSDRDCSWYAEHNGLKFKIESAGLYGENYADFNHYVLRRVDSFDVNQ